MDGHHRHQLYCCCYCFLTDIAHKCKCLVGSPSPHQNTKTTQFSHYKKKSSNRKISPQGLIILHVGKVSMHDIKSATWTVLLSDMVSAMKIGERSHHQRISYKKTFLLLTNSYCKALRKIHLHFFLQNSSS